VLRELSKALRGKVKLSTARTTEIVDFVVGEAVQVVEKVDPAEAKVDADDALVLDEAIAGQAEIFVTGDAALLGLAGIGALLVVSLRRLWEILHFDRAVIDQPSLKGGGPWHGGAGDKRGSAGRSKAARDDPGEAQRLPAQALVEHELGHGCWGVGPVETGSAAWSHSGGSRAGATPDQVRGSLGWPKWEAEVLRLPEPFPSHPQTNLTH